MSILANKKVTYTDENASWWKRSLNFLGELIKVALVVTVIVVPIRYFLIQPFYVKGASMEPNFLDNQYLIIDEISYRFREPERGEIIVFRYPKDESQFFIKRVIGLPGDTVTITGGKVYVQKKGTTSSALLDESAYLAADVQTLPQVLPDKVTVGDDEYFVLGDNRAASYDSRYFGFVPKKDLVGRVALRGWPITDLKTFTAPVYKL
jgi:signal peptidase I